MPSVLDVIRRRKSCRSYADRELGPELKQQIEAVLLRPDQGFFGGAPQFVLVERARVQSEEKLKLGTYGFIQGAPYFIAGAIERRTLAEVDFGYLAENIVLEMTALGLGTCWLGGTFSRDEYARVLHLDDRHWIPAILALGYPADAKGLAEKLIRWGAKADARLPWSSLFFDGDFSPPLTREAAGDWGDVLDAVRIGPSASNKQPWRIIRDDQGLHLFLARSLSEKKPACPATSFWTNQSG